MAGQIKNVIITGASGNLGRPILDAIVNSGKFHVSVINRPGSKASYPSSVKVLESDSSEASLRSVLEGQDAVVNTVGSGGFEDYQKPLIDACIKAGVKRYIPSDFGTDTQNPKSIEICPVFEGKAQALKYLREKEKEGGSFTWTSIANGAFLDWNLRNGGLDFYLDTSTAKIWESGTQPFAATPLAWVGTAVVNALLKPEETANKYLYIAGAYTTQNELLEALEKMQGKKWTVEHTTTEREYKPSLDKLYKGDYSGIPALIMAQTYGYGGPGGDFLKHGRELSNKLLGLDEPNLEAALKSFM